MLVRGAIFPVQLRHLIFLSLLAFACWRWHGATRRLPSPGVAVAEKPVYQSLVTAQGLPSQCWPVGQSGYSATPFATVHLRARVLGTKRYHDATADFAPTDFIFGWGRMSDPTVYLPLQITPDSRSYHYLLTGSPIPQTEINAHSIEYHLIPANEDVAGALGEVNLDDIVVLDGQLVAVRGPVDAADHAGPARVGNICATCRMFRVTRVGVEPRAAP